MENAQQNAAMSESLECVTFTLLCGYGDGTSLDSVNDTVKGVLASLERELGTVGTATVWESKCHYAGKYPGTDSCATILLTFNPRRHDVEQCRTFARVFSDNLAALFEQAVIPCYESKCSVSVGKPASRDAEAS